MAIWATNTVMKKYFLPLVIILLSSLLAFSILTKDHEWGDDWASYIMQAISITQGKTDEFIQHNTFTMRESTHFIGPDAYPWGYPAFLAPFTLACGPLNVFCLKFINLIFFALFLWVFYALLIRRLPPLESALLLAVFAFSPLMLKFEDSLLSDIAFLFFSMLGLLLIENVILRDENYLGSLRRNIWLGISLFLAFFVRTNGILLVPTLFLVQIFTYLQTRPRPVPDWKRILTIGLIPYYIFGLLAIVNLILFPAGEGSHLEHLSNLSLSTLANNLSAYFALPAYFFNDLQHPEILYGLLLPFILGGIILYFKSESHFVFYLFLSYALFIIWPDQQGIRFLFPLLPLLIYFAFRGMQATFFALTERHSRFGLWLTRTFWLVIIAIFAWTSLGLARDNLAQGRGPYGNAFDPISIGMFEFIKSNTPADSVIAFYKPRAMRLFTDRDSLLVDRCDALSMANFVVLRKSRGAVDQISPADVTTCNPSVHVTEVFDNKKFVVYQISPP
jgi:hypothetical protein